MVRTASDDDPAHRCTSWDGKDDTPHARLAAKKPDTEYSTELREWLMMKPPDRHRAAGARTYSGWRFNVSSFIRKDVSVRWYSGTSRSKTKW